jgi:hypothetical protein
MHNKNYAPKNPKTTNNLEQMDYTLNLNPMLWFQTLNQIMKKDAIIPFSLKIHSKPQFEVTNMVLPCSQAEKTT